MSDKNLVLALNIKERILNLYNRYDSQVIDEEQIILKWRKKFGELDEKNLKLYLDASEISQKEFAVGVKTLNECDIEELYRFLKNQRWYKIHKDIFYDKKYDNDGTLEFFTKPYMLWLSDKISVLVNKTKIKIKSEAIEAVIKKLSDEIISIALKTLIYDQEEMQGKQNTQLSTAEYIKKRFCSSNDYILFFNDYPALARILSTRTEYAYENFKKLVLCLQSSMNECMQLFGLSNFVIQEMELSKGDSHSEGKAVTILKIDGRKLVFKYKNLKVGRCLNDLYIILENLDSSFCFYKVKRVLGSDFTIEEYVEHNHCLTEKEISDYYFKFGELVFLAYILNGTDFHYENIVASRNLPVLIDVETLFQNSLPIINEKKAVDRYINNYKDSVAGSSLLPNATCGRCESELIELSGLAGDEQRLSHEVLQMSMEGEKVQLVSKPCVMKSAKNLPILNGKKMYYKKYIKDVLAGFEYAFEVVNKNKEFIKQSVNNIFRNCVVRNVLRNTQNYAEMLEFSYHPSRMTNYTNREHLFINLWTYRLRNKELLLQEQEELLKNDIPIFYNRINEKSIISDTGKKVDNIYINTAIELVLNKISALSNVELKRQKNILIISLGAYNGESNFHKLKTVSQLKSVDVAKEIADLICNRFIVGEDHSDLVLQTILLNSTNVWKNSLMTKSYYDGLAGIYLFLYELNIRTNNYQYYMNILYDLLCKSINDIKNIYEYNDAFGILYVLIRRIQKEKLTKDIIAAENLLEKIMKYYDEYNELPDDWLLGKSSLVHICSKLYSIIGKQNILDWGIKIAKSISYDNVEEYGFAHGISGIIYGLLSLWEVSEFSIKKYLHVKICEGYRKVIEKILTGGIDSVAWCNGFVGIAYMMLKVRKYSESLNLKDEYLFDNKLIEQIASMEAAEDSLCHGKFGKVDFMITIYNYYPLPYDLKIRIKKCIEESMTAREGYKIRGLTNEPLLDLMTGFAGIGYEYIRVECPDIPSVLLLE